jgi:hypothetical protein
MVMMVPLSQLSLSVGMVTGVVVGVVGVGEVGEDDLG